MASDKEIENWLNDHQGTVAAPQPAAKGQSDAEIEAWLNTPAKTAEQPHFWQLEKQPGVPASNLDRFKQLGQDYLTALKNPMPGSLITAPVTSAQHFAQELGPTVARATQDTLGTWGARAAGAAASMLTDPTSYVGGELNIGKAVAPAERAAAVETAQQMGIPLTRAEVTGGRAAAGIESGLEKTLTGSEPINQVRTTQAAKLQEFTDSAIQKHGTLESPTSIGNTIQNGANENINAAKMTAQDLYKQIPNLPVHTPNFEAAAKDVLAEQMRLPTANQNPELIKAASEYVSLAKQNVKYVEAWGRSNTSTPMSEVPLALDTLRAIQSDLGDKLSQAKRLGQSTATPAARGWATLRSAIETDIGGLSNSKDVVSKFLGTEAANKLTRANAAWKGMRELDSNPLIKSIRLSAPEDVAAKIFAKGRVTDVITARAALGDGAFNVAKSQYFTQLIKDPKLGTTLSKLQPEFLQSVFNRTELSALHTKVALSKLLGAAEKMGGQAGSARSNTISLNTGAVGAGLGAAGLSALHLNLPGVIGGLATAAAAYKAPAAAAKAYLKYGVKGLNIPMAAPGVGQIMQQGQSGLISNASNPMDVIRRYIKARR